MHAIDIVILFLLALPALVGVCYGFLNIAFSLLAWALALGIAAKFTPVFAAMLVPSVETPIFRIMLAFTGLFIISLLIFTVIGLLVVKLLGRAGLTATDRILGLFFGMGLGAVIVFVMVFLAGFTAVPSEAWWERSLLLQPFERVSVWAGRYLPRSMAEYHGYRKSAPADGAKDKHTSSG
ncbi:MAG: CvpA family protein [Gammaproteobacteria bacterium]